MKPLFYILIAIVCFLAVLGAFALATGRLAKQPTIPSPAAVRDSIELRRDTVRIETEKYIVKIKRIPQDTLAPILRALANRPVIYQRDTIRLDSSEADTCSITLTCQDGRRLLLRDTVNQVQKDSLRGELRISQVRGDSLAAHLSSCLNAKPRWGYVAAFEAGYLLGTVVTGGICAVVR